MYILAIQLICFYYILLIYGGLNNFMFIIKIQIAGMTEFNHLTEYQKEMVAVIMAILFFLLSPVILMLMYKDYFK